MSRMQTTDQEKESGFDDPFDVLRSAALLDPPGGRDGWPAVLSCAGWRIDLTRQRWNRASRERLQQEARERGVIDGFRRQFSGDPVNVTEHRAALHMALRDAPGGTRYRVGGAAVGADVDAVLEGRACGATDRSFRDVVNIGIGGSDLGPRMALRALDAQAVPAFDGEPLRVHCVSNVDGQAIAAVLAQCDPETTLFVVVSKTFSTWETLTNARTAREWLVATLGDAAVASHFVAVSTAIERAAVFGIPESRCFGFWDWVGGRYSLWSAVGLALQLRIGVDGFSRLLAGARAVDEHVAAHLEPEQLADNVPLQLALIDYANQNRFGASSRAVIAYDERLALWPAYLQQAEMESLGKSVRVDGSVVTESTGAVVWGAVGTDGQHAFFQLLHQGTQVIPVDFIGVAAPDAVPGFVPPPTHRGQHRILLANLLAQADALAIGRSDAEVAAEHPELSAAERAHRVFAGGRPSSVWLAAKLGPEELGALIAIQEHRIFALSRMWGINAFDQWGVELGKALAGPIHQAMERAADGEVPEAKSTMSDATLATIEYLQSPCASPSGRSA